MALSDKKLISLREIEGAQGPHQAQLDRALRLRASALEHLTDVAGAARFIGGRVESLGLREDWAISKEVLPGVEVFFIFNRADEEFPSRLRALYSGERARQLKGDNLPGVAVMCVNHVLRYIRETNPGKELPEVCYKV